MKLPSIVIRTRASLEYGWGHLMRSQRLLGHLRSQHPETQIDLVVEGDAGVHRMGEEWNLPWHRLEEGTDPSEEAEWIDALGPSIIIADLIEIENSLRGVLRARSQLFIAFDDLSHGYPEADILISPQIPTVPPVLHEGQRWLAGTDYYLLDESLREEPGPVRRRIEKVVVVMGGCLTERVTRWLEELGRVLAKAPFCTNILVGFDGGEGLPGEWKTGDGRVAVVAGTRDVGKWMRDADLAVAASGYVKFELAAAGTPTLLTSIVPHQHELGTLFAQRTGAAKYLGPIEEVSADAILEHVLALATEREERQKMASAGRRAVDGAGADRILGEIQEAWSRIEAGPNKEAASR